MYIKNQNLANSALRLRNGQSSVGDPEGIFEVPDTEGQQLIETPGWTVSDKAPQLPEEVDPVKALRELRAAQRGQPLQTLPQPPAPGTPAPTTPVGSQPEQPTPAAPLAPPAATTQPAEGGEEEAPEEIDLTVMGQKELLAVAKTYEVEVPSKIARGKVEALRAFVDKALFGE